MVALVGVRCFCFSVFACARKNSWALTISCCMLGGMVEEWG